MHVVWSIEAGLDACWVDNISVGNSNMNDSINSRYDAQEKLYYDSGTTV